MKKNYFTEINIARGLTVLFVLLGHSIPDAQTSDTQGIIIKFIETYCYSFHMALFFMLSGFVSATGIKNKIFMDELSKKFKRLLIPYFFYSILTLFLKLIFSEYANNKFDLKDCWKILFGQNPNGGIWFLWTLFFVWVLSFGCMKIFLKEEYILMFSLFLYFCNVFFELGYAASICGYFIFFAIGMFIYSNYNAFKKFLSGNIIYSYISLIALGIWSCLNIHVNGIYLITALVGGLSIWNLSIYISKKENKLNKILNIFGDYSYDIYLLSYFIQVPIRVICFRILNLPYVIVVLMMFVGGLIIPLLCSKYMIRRTKYIKRFVVGDWK